MSLPLPDPDDDALWTAALRAEAVFWHARAGFMQRAKDRVTVIRRALTEPSERPSALRLVPLLREDERESLFPALVATVPVSHRDVRLAREAILSLPREWVISRIEDEAEPLLRDGTYEEYRRFLELYYLLDPTLTRSLAERALESDDPDIAEAGEDFLELLEGPWPQPL